MMHDVSYDRCTFFFSSRRRHTRWTGDWSSDVCSSDLTVHEGGFANQSVVTEAPKKKVASSENPATPVDILEKPHPVYTAEGRSLKIEGDVVLDMVFLANGSIQVNRVLSGLGHGLDDAAMRAAQLIKFKPAKRDGQPVDFPARVRIEFRLAY